MLGDDVLRRPRALPLPQRGVRAVRARQRPAARHVPERDEVRGRDHRDGARPDARRRRARHRRRPGWSPAGGTDSLVHAMLAYREYAAQERGIDGRRRPTSSSRRPRTRRSTRRPGCSGMELAVAPGRPRTRPSTRPRWPSRSTTRRSGSSGRPATTATARSTRSPSSAQLALDRGVGLHVDGCLGGFILPFGEELGYDIPPFDFRRAGGHLDLGRHPQVRLLVQGHLDAAVPRQGLPQRAVLRAGRLERRQVHARRASPGSRSGGLLAASWAAMVQSAARATSSTPGRSSRPPSAMQAVVRSHPELRIIGRPTFCFSFTSDAFDIYHVNDFMRERGWRFNGQQYPNAIHMAVTGRRPSRGSSRRSRPTSPRPSPTPRRTGGGRQPAFSGAIYGGVAGGLTTRSRSSSPRS